MSASDVLLRQRSGEAHFVHEADQVAVPPRSAQRCALIADLRRQHDPGTVEVTLPLSISECKAWLALAQEVDGGDNLAPKACTNIHGIDTLSKALRAADFLGDTVTTAAVFQLLLDAILGDCSRSLAPPSDEECAKACQIVGQTPQHLLPDVFAAIDRQSSTPATDLPATLAVFSELELCSSWQLSRLVQLLPLSFHPAILRACCSSAADATSFQLPPLPPCAVTCATHRRQHDAEERRREGDDALVPDIIDPSRMHGADQEETPINTVFIRDSPCGAECASLMTQLLEAAALVAAGGPESARDQAEPPQGCGLGGEPEHAPDAPPGKQPTRTSGDQPAVKRVRRGVRHTLAPATEPRSPRHPTGGLFRLSVLLSHPSSDDPLANKPVPIPAVEPPRWCAALAQLHTLRELHVSAFNPSRLSPRELGPALLALPALRTLSLSCNHCVYLSRLTCPRADIVSLLGAVTGLTQLSALALKHTFYAGCVRSMESGVESGVREVSELSRLTQLTALAVTCACEGGLFVTPPVQAWSLRALASAVQPMSLLQELQMTLIPEDTEGPGPCGGVLLPLCASTLLSSLKNLSLPGCHIGAHWQFTLQDLHMYACRFNPQLLARLTALDLSGNSIGSEFTGSSATADLLRDTPALRSLRLGRNYYEDAALETLVPVIPSLPGLTRLCIDGNMATHSGLFAVLEAFTSSGNACDEAAGSGTTGQAREGLQELDISGTYVVPEHAAELASLLRQLRSLETLAMIGLGLGEEGVVAVVEALESLPRLRCLRVSIEDAGAAGLDAPASERSRLKHVRVEQWLAMWWWS